MRLRDTVEEFEDIDGGHCDSLLAGDTLKPGDASAPFRSGPHHPSVVLLAPLAS